MTALEATLAGSGTSWTASLALLTTREPVTATGTSPAAALRGLVPVALQQVASEAAAQGVPLGPVELVAAEMRVRAACSLGLFRYQTPTPTLVVTDEYGTDVSTFPDLDPKMLPITGQRAVAEAVARRWITPLGALIYDPAYGEDLRGLLNAPTDSARLRSIRGALVGQALSDERVQSATVDLSATGSGNTLTVTVRGRLVSGIGPFDLVLTVNQLAANLQILRS